MNAQLVVAPNPPALAVGEFRKNGLTAAQSMLVDIMNECVREGRSFSIEDAISCWSVANNTWECGIRAYDSSIGAYVMMDVWDIRVRPMVKYKATTWLAHNIGICVMKGAIIAIPVMNIKTHERATP